MADPGFLVGGRGSRGGGRGLPNRLRSENFVCQNKRIWTLRGAYAGTPPLDPPMKCPSIVFKQLDFNQVVSGLCTLLSDSCIHRIYINKQSLQQRNEQQMKNEEISHELFIQKQRQFLHRYSRKKEKRKGWKCKIWSNEEKKAMN